MPDDGTRVLKPATSDTSATPDEAGRERSNETVEPSSQSTSERRRWLRPALFMLLPFVLIAGGYWYVTGGQVMSSDDAYVEADKVGVSTDVSGIVKEVAATENRILEVG